MPKHSDLSSDEQARWLKSWQETADALATALTRLQVKRANLPTGPGSAVEAAKLDRQITDMGRDILEHDRNRLDILTNSLALTPPSPAQVTKIKELSDKVDALVAGSQATDQIVQAAKETLALYQQVTA
jgi:hypothetical protein